MKLKKIKTLYDEINSQFFDDLLPFSHIRVTKNKRKFGQFYIRRNYSIIELNLDMIIKCEYDIKEILIHEMCHLWQDETLETEPENEHDKYFLDKLFSICYTLKILPKHAKDYYEYD